MSFFKKSIDFDILAKANMIEKTIEYFSSFGFKLTKQKENKLTFTYGSLFQNKWTFNPLKWKSKIKIQIRGDKINADFIIDARGQIITEKENNIWDMFINNYRLFLLDNIDYNSINKKALNEVKKSNIKLVSWTLFGGIVGGLLAVPIAILTSLPMLIHFGVISFAILFFMRKFRQS